LIIVCKLEQPHYTYLTVFHTGNNDMEGVEQDAEDSMYDSPQKVFDITPESGVDMDEDTDNDAVYGTARQAALSHSLPAHLHLDPVKMQQMRALFFNEGSYGLFCFIKNVS
jgi:hypothetical protein